MPANSPGGEGEAEPARLTAEVREELSKRYETARIEDWSDTPVSQLRETEASSFTRVADWVSRLTGADIYLLNTKRLGVALEPQKGSRAAGQFLTLNGRPAILVSADLLVARGYSPARTLTHEGLHALFKKHGRDEMRGKLRAKSMADMTLLKGYNAFKTSPLGESYAEPAKGNEATVYEEYAAKVFAHQYGTEAEQKAIEKFVSGNDPDFPLAEYVKEIMSSCSGFCRTPPQPTGKRTR